MLAANGVRRGLPVVVLARTETAIEIYCTKIKGRGIDKGCSK